MKIKIQEYQLDFNHHRLYDLFLDDDKDEIEIVVTRNLSSVKDWINNTEILNRCRLHRLIVGLDIEWRPQTWDDDCMPPVATLQLCVGKSCLVFQIFQADRISRKLRQFLEDPDYTFVGVGIKNDVRKLWNDYGLKVTHTRDLRFWAADELDMKGLRNVGLSALVKRIVRKDMEKPKAVTMSRWDNYALTRGQVTYACLDAYFSFEIGRLLSSWY